MRAARGAIVLGAFLFLVALSGPASAQRSGINVAGDFAFYVLALSWSPSYCQAEGTAADRMQCSSGRRYSFVVHGLWPQYQRGWPEYCPASPSHVPETTVRSMLDLMPSDRLVRHQWDKHGTCSGLSPQGYFEATRAARARIVIPDAFTRLDRTVMVDPGEVERAFIAANPGLTADALAVTCDRQRLREVRVCLTRTLDGFRSCPEIDRRACGLSRAVMPPVRDR